MSNDDNDFDIDHMTDEQRLMFRRFVLVDHVVDYLRLILAQECAAAAARAVQNLVDGDAKNAATLRRLGGEPLPDHFWWCVV